MEKLKIDYIPLNQIHAYKKNAKTHPVEQVHQIANSIEQFGMNDPIAIDERGMIIEGHGRALALEQLSKEGKYDADFVPVIRLNGLTDEQKKAYILAHNQTCLNSGFDIDILNAELASITNINMADFGFLDVNDDTGADSKVAAEDDFDAPLPSEAESQRGDMYQLGQHRLMCGDSTSPEDMRVLMNGEQADLLITDPPYGVAIGTKNKELSEIEGGKHGHRCTTDIAGDTLPPDALHDMLTKAMKNAYEAAKDDCAYYVFAPTGGNLGLAMMTMMQDAGWELRHQLIWVKNAATFSMGRLDYDYRHEPIMYGWKKTHHFYRTEYKNTVIEQKIDVDTLTEKQAKKILREIIKQSDEMPTTVLRYDKPRSCDLHPTMKPVSLFGELIKNSTKQNNIVLDLFGGSGTTIIACEQLNRSARVMEYDPRYVDVIIKRWEQFTGEHAVLMSRKAA